VGTHGPCRRTCEGGRRLKPDAQLPLLGPRGGLNPRVPAHDPAPSGVARVLIDSGLPHLDRFFDYLIPAKMADEAEPGVRVRVRLAGRSYAGYILSRTDTSEHRGKLLPLSKVVSPVPVLPPSLARLCREVADHYAGSMSDVVRLAVPPRYAAAESAWMSETANRASAVVPTDRVSTGTDLSNRSELEASSSGPVEWGSQPSWRGVFLDRLDSAPRTTWCCPPTQDWVEPLAQLVVGASTQASPTLVVLPDWRDVERFSEAIELMVDPATVAVLRAGLGPQARYEQYLKVLAGLVGVVVGTRSAAFAPLPNLKLCVIWDDGDPNHAEQRAPYPHARDVLAMRSHEQKTAFLCAGYTRTPEVQRWVDGGWLQPIPLERGSVRAIRPTVSVTEDSDRSPLDTVARLPPSAMAALRTGVETGPVLVQVARRGYIPVSACGRCRQIASCRKCGGSLAISDPDEAGGQLVECRKCGHTQAEWTCRECGGQALRAVAMGAGRTAHELGRLLPAVPIHISTGDHPLDRVSGDPGIVVATSGLEPRADGGYLAGFFPDAEIELWRSGATARTEALRRWFGAASLLRAGAPLRIAADPANSTVQALIRWDPIGASADQLAERAELLLPPVARLVRVDGSEADLADLIEAIGELPGLRVLGPREHPDKNDQVRVALTATDGGDLVRRVRRIVVARAAARSGQPLRVHVDPQDLD
jgi:primosomal protein N' (replication factor Y)